MSNNFLPYHIIAKPRLVSGDRDKVSGDAEHYFCFAHDESGALSSVKHAIQEAQTQSDNRIVGWQFTVESGLFMNLAPDMPYEDKDLVRGVYRI